MDDVLVVGAGPAGNHAALLLAQRGYNVKVVDRRRLVGDKLCSGIVGAECLRHFPADESQVLRAVNSADVYAPSGETLHVSREDPQAYVLDRVAYVGSFANRAQDAGATYLLGHTLRSLSVEPGGLTATVVNGAGPQTLHARAAVIASGFGSRITRMAGLGQVSDYVVGVQAEVMAPQAEEIDLYVGRQLAPGFFGWLAPTSGGRALVGLLSRRNGGQLLRQLLSRLQESGKVASILTPPKRWGIPLKPLARASRDRVVAVGDAAGQVKPATGGGIYYSLLSSQIAAETLHQSIRAGDLSASALQRYEREWHALVGDELDIEYSARRLFELLSDKQIDHLIRTLSRNGTAASIWGLPVLNFDWPGLFIRTILGMPLMHQALNVLGVVVPRVLRRSV